MTHLQTVPFRQSEDQFHCSAYVVPLVPNHRECHCCVSTDLPPKLGPPTAHLASVSASFRPILCTRLLHLAGALGPPPPLPPSLSQATRWLSIALLAAPPVPGLLPLPGTSPVHSFMQLPRCTRDRQALRFDGGFSFHRETAPERTAHPPSVAHQPPSVTLQPPSATAQPPSVTAQI